MTTQKETQSESSQSPITHGGPGLRLQEARVKAGLSVDDVATHLRLRVSVIEELEENQFNNMAGLVFVRGYLRAYANALNINADEVIALFNELNVKEHVPEGSMLQSRQPTERNERPIRWLMLVIAFGVSILAVLWWNAQRHHNKAIKVPQAVVKTSPDVVTPIDEHDSEKKQTLPLVKQNKPVKQAVRPKRMKG